MVAFSPYCRLTTLYSHFYFHHVIYFHFQWFNLNKTRYINSEGWCRTIPCSCFLPTVDCSRRSTLRFLFGGRFAKTMLLEGTECMTIQLMRSSLEWRCQRMFISIFHFCTAFSSWQGWWKILAFGSPIITTAVKPWIFCQRLLRRHRWYFELQKTLCL